MKENGKARNYAICGSNAYCFDCLIGFYVVVNKRFCNMATLEMMARSCPQYTFWKNVSELKIETDANGLVPHPPGACICCRDTYSILF